MAKVSPLVLLRIPLVVAIAASTVLVIEYRHAGDPSFCSAGSGCMKVRLSPYSSLFGVPLPIIGLAAYTLLFVISLVAKERLHLRVLTAIATIGGLLGAGLIALQGFAVEAFCKWCVTVDVSGILAGAAAWFLLLSAQSAESEEAIVTTQRDLGVLGAWIASALLGVVLPFVWSFYPVAQPLPVDLEPYLQPSKLNVISFTDFQCPFCRRLHPTLDRLRSESPIEVNFTRFMTPLPHHDGAMPAALAFQCTPEPLKERMALKLYAMPVDRLKTATPDVAEQMGIDRPSFLACVADEKTKAAVEHDIALFKKIDGAGLPLTYVGTKAVVGANLEQLKEAFASAHDVGRAQLPVVWMWIALGLAYAGAALLTLRAHAAALSQALANGSTPEPPRADPAPGPSVDPAQGANADAAPGASAEAAPAASAEGVPGASADAAAEASAEAGAQE